MSTNGEVVDNPKSPTKSPSSASGPSSGSFGNQFFCGALAGIFAEFVTQPLDVIKIRLQLDLNKKNILHKKNHQSPHININNTQNNNHSIGAIRTSINIIKTEGMRGLYKGLPPASCRQILKSGTQMSIYGWLGGLISVNGGSDRRSVKISKKVFVASCGGALGQILANPADVVKIRLQADGRRLSLNPPLALRYPNGSLQAFYQIIKQDGLLSFWRGSAPSVLRASLSSGVGVASYDEGKRMILHYGEAYGVKDNWRVHISLSVFSAFISTCVAAPLDLVKTRLMDQDFAKPVYKGTLHCLSHCIQNEGLLSLYKGFWPTYFRIAPWQMSFFFTFEQLSRLINGHHL